MKLRNKEKYRIKHAKTARLRNSAVEGYENTTK